VEEITQVELIELSVDGEAPIVVPALFYQDKWWLADRWLDTSDERFEQPERIVRIDLFPGLQERPSHPRSRFLFQMPVPKSLFSATSQQLRDSGLEVEDEPPIVVRNTSFPPEPPPIVFQ